MTEIKTIWIPDPVSYFGKMTDAEIAGCGHCGHAAEYITHLRGRIEIWRRMYNMHIEELHRPLDEDL